MILNLYNSKDASAAAIYGSRAANGVIVILLKKEQGRVKVLALK
jgi:TonB-dependent SusC/RagA subfamily outer membrane receptor